MNTDPRHERLDLGPWSQRTAIVYDGECPFCSRYINWQRLQEECGPVELIDARQGGDLVARLTAAGFDLDKGMVLVRDGQAHHGAECLNRLAQMTQRSNAFNRFNATVFSSLTFTRLVYPMLRACRTAALLLLGRGKIANLSGTPDQPLSTKSRLFAFIRRGGRRQRREYPESARRVSSDRGRER